jgi:hypothetical protein
MYSILATVLNFVETQYNHIVLVGVAGLRISSKAAPLEWRKSILSKHTFGLTFCPCRRRRAAGVVTCLMASDTRGTEKGRRRRVRAAGGAPRRSGGMQPGARRWGCAGPVLRGALGGGMGARAWTFEMVGND